MNIKSSTKYLSILGVILGVTIGCDTYNHIQKIEPNIEIAKISTKIANNSSIIDTTKTNSYNQTITTVDELVRQHKGHYKVYNITKQSLEKKLDELCQFTNVSPSDKWTKVEDGWIWHDNNCKDVGVRETIDRVLIRDSWLKLEMKSVESTSTAILYHIHVYDVRLPYEENIFSPPSMMDILSRAKSSTSIEKEGKIIIEKVVTPGGIWTYDVDSTLKKDLCKKNYRFSNGYIQLNKHMNDAYECMLILENPIAPAAINKYIMEMQKYGLILEFTPRDDIITRLKE